MWEWRSGKTAVLVLFSAACSERPTLVPAMTSDSAGVELVKLQELPPLTDPAWLWQLQLERSISTVDSQGEPIVFFPSSLLPVQDDLVVLDSQGNHKLVVLNLETQNAEARGIRSGRGPGEFNYGELLPGSSGQFRVFDRQNDKVLTYNLALELIREASLSPRGHSLVAEELTDDELVIERWEWKGGGTKAGLSRVRVDGEVTALMDLPDPPRYEGGSNLQIGRVVWQRVGNEIVAMKTTEPYFYVFNLKGNLVRKIHLPLTRRRLSEEDIERQIAEHGAMARGLRPGPIALTNLLYEISDTIFGTLQSELWRAEEDPVVESGRIMLRMVSTSGRYVGAVLLPKEYLMLWNGGGRSWGRQPDSVGVPVLQERVLVAPN